jgi:hypothetical protein
MERYVIHEPNQQPIVVDLENYVKFVQCGFKPGTIIANKFGGEIRILDNGKMAANHKRNLVGIPYNIMLNFEWPGMFGE